MMGDGVNADPFGHVMVLGAGAWGTALAVHLARAGRRVTLWARSPALADEMNERRENPAYLPDVPLPDGLAATSDAGTIAEVDAALCVIPAQHMRAQLGAFAAAAGDRPLPVALCSKGIEQSTGLLMHDVLSEVWPRAGGAVLSGPSFAADVARGLPTAVTLADADEERGARWGTTLATSGFRPYYSADVRGVELGGAYKNVLAIACGVVEGRDLGNSAKAALMARGFAECMRFAGALGARPETLNGLSGLGDIILTCSSRQSRNMSLGYEIGKGRRAATVLAERHSVAEGAATAPILTALAAEKGVDVPVANAVVTLLEGKAPVDDVMEALMTRPLKPELSS